MVFKVKLFEKIPSDVAGVGVGAYAGFLTDKIAEYIYVNTVPAAKRPVTPVFALDDWIVLLVGLGISAISEKWEFGLGWLLGHLIGSGWFT